MHITYPIHVFGVYIAETYFKQYVCGEENHDSQICE